MTAENNLPGEVNNAHRNSLEPRQLGRVPHPTALPVCHWEVSKSNSFVRRSARRGSSEIYSLAVDTVEGLAGREIRANIDRSC